MSGNPIAAAIAATRTRACQRRARSRGADRKSRSAEDGAATLETGRGPELLRIIVGLECRDACGQPEPWLLRPRVDVDVRPQRRWIVEGADADETEDAAAAVVAPDRGLAGGAAIDLVRLPAVGGHRHRPGLARQQRDPVGLDQGVENEGAAGLALAVETVAAVDQ